VTSLRIFDVGAAGPLGLTARQWALGYRARRLEPRTSKIRDKRRRYVGIVRSRWLSDDLYGAERLVRLGREALGEAAKGLTRPLPLVLCVPQRERPDLRDGEVERLPVELAEAAGVAIDPRATAIHRLGHAGFAARATPARA
jgi:hypothetical protein